MPLIRPTLDQLFAQAKMLINIYLPGTDANLQKNFLNILAIIISQMSNGQYGYLDFLSEQIFADTCEEEYLDRLVGIRGLQRKAAQNAVGVNVPATGNDGAIITQGTQLQRLDGVFYTVTADVAISGGTAIMNLEAAEVGENGNADAGTQLNFISPPPGVNTLAIVGIPGIAGGTDLETDAELRARYLVFIRKPPQGGAKNDYEIWSLEVPGVTRAWVYPLENGRGTVTVRFLVEPTIANPNGIPDSAQINELFDYIEIKRPVTAKNITIEAPIPVELDFDIELEVEDNIDIRNAIIASLQAMLLRDAQPQGNPGSEIKGTIYLSRINEAISLAAGEYAHKLISPTDDVTYTLGQIAVYGETTFS